MRSFELVEPTTLAEAVTLVDRHDPGVRIIAGGTALMLMMKARLYQPTRLVSLRHLGGELRGVRTTPEGGVRVGALTSLTELERSPAIAAAVPVVTTALRTLSNVRIRNVATLGGHLAHGDPHMDLPPILLTLGARVRAASPRGERSIPFGDLHRGYYQTSLDGDELIVGIDVPPQPAGVRAAYAKFTALSADDWPAVGVAVWCRLEADTIVDARVAVSAATDCPVRVEAAETCLTGRPASSTAIRQAADAAAEAIEPLSDIRGTADYKREMVRVHARRALEQALAGAPGGQ